MSELPPSGAALDKLLAGGGEAELRRRYAADLHAAGLGVPSRRLESSACSARGVRGSGVENSAKKDKSGQPEIHNLDTKKIQLYSFLEAETAAYVSSICFLNCPRSNRCRL